MKSIALNNQSTIYPVGVKSLDGKYQTTGKAILNYNISRDDVTGKWVAHINGARRNLTTTRIGSYKMLCDILAKEWLHYCLPEMEKLS